MIQTDPIFLGVVPRGARSYVAREVVRLGKPLFNACAGRFSVIEAAVKADLPAAKVHASDIGLFSSLIGYLADDSKRLEDLGIRILDPDLEPRDVKDELDFAAHVMLILKLNQLSQTNLRGLYLREELLASWSRYRQAVHDELEVLVATIKGIHYKVADAADSDYAPLEKAVRRINEEYDVRVVADIIGKMADLALEACGGSVEGPERVHLKDLFGTAYIPKEAAEVVKSALAAMLKAGDISQTNRWEALEYWASDWVAK